MAASLVVLGCSAPATLRCQEPVHSRLRIATFLTPDEALAFDRVLAATIQGDEQLAGLVTETRPYRSPGSDAGLPPRGEWDVAVGFLGSALTAAAQRGDLLALADGRPYAVVHVVPYSVLHRGGSQPLLTWGDLLGGEGDAVLAPDPRLEIEFGEALATLLASRGAAAIASFLSRRRLAADTSTSVRGLASTQSAAIAVAALDASECVDRGERLPAAEVGMAIAAGVTDRGRARRLVSLLAAPETRRRWLLRREGIAPENLVRAAVHAPPGARELDTLRVILESPYGTSEAEASWQGWLETGLLVVFGVLFLVIVLGVGRAKR